MAPKRSAKTSARPAGRVKKNVLLPPELARQLGAYAAWHGRNESDIVAEALAPVLAGFYCATRGGASDRPAAASGTEPGPAAEPPELRVA